VLEGNLYPLRGWPVYCWCSWFCCSGRNDVNSCVSWDRFLDLSFGCSLRLFRRQRTLILAVSGGIRVAVLGTLVMGFSEWRCRCVFEVVQSTSHPSSGAMLHFSTVFREMEFVQRNRPYKDRETSDVLLPREQYEFSRCSK